MVGLWLLFLEHFGQERPEPVLEGDVVFVGHDEVSDAVEPLQTQIATLQPEILISSSSEISRSDRLLLVIWMHTPM